MSPRKKSSKKAKEPWKPEVRTLDEVDETPFTDQPNTLLLETLILNLVKSFPIRILPNCDYKSRRATEKFMHIDLDVSHITEAETSRAAEKRAGTWKGKGKATAADLSSNDSEPEPEPEPELESLEYLIASRECFECQWRKRQRGRLGLIEQDSNPHSNNRTSPPPSSPSSFYHSLPDSATSSMELLRGYGRSVPRQIKKGISDTLSSITRCCCYWQ